MTLGVPENVLPKIYLSSAVITNHPPPAPAPSVLLWALRARVLPQEAEGGMMRGEPSKRTSLDLKQFIDKVPVCAASRLFHDFVEQYFGLMFH